MPVEIVPPGACVRRSAFAGAELGRVVDRHACRVSNLNVQNSPSARMQHVSIAGLGHSYRQAQPQNYRLDSFKLPRSPEYLLRDWSFLTARPRAFFWPTTTSNCLARVIPV